MKAVIVTLLLVAGSAHGAKFQKSLSVQIQCENVATAATNAIGANMTVGTSDDAFMLRSADLGPLPLTAGQATALTNLCGIVATAIKTANSIP